MLSMGVEDGTDTLENAVAISTKTEQTHPGNDAAFHS